MNSAVETGLQLFIACVFMLSSSSKLRNLDRFAAGLGAYSLLPRPMVRPGAFIVAVGEFVLAVVVVAGPRIGLPAALVLLSAFLSVQVRAILRGDRLACHCFDATEMVDAGSVARTGWFLVLAAVGVLLSSSPGSKSIDDAFGAALVILFATTVAMWAKNWPLATGAFARGSG